MKYKESIRNISNELLLNKGSVLITGATGLIGSCIADILLEANRNGAQFEIFTMSRSLEKIKKDLMVT